MISRMGGLWNLWYFMGFVTWRENGPRGLPRLDSNKNIIRAAQVAGGSSKT